jgi:hypothetical protein
MEEPAKQDWSPYGYFKETPWRLYREDGHRYRIKAEYRKDPERGLRMRAEIQYRPTYANEWTHYQSGQLLIEIHKHFPELQPYIKWVDLQPRLYSLRSVDWAKEIWADLRHDPGDERLLQIFSDTVVWGIVPGEETLPDLDVPWEVLEPWLVARLPILMKTYGEDMKRLRALSLK